MSAPGSLRLPRWVGAFLVVLMAAGRAPAAEPPDQPPREDGVLLLPPVQVVAPAPLPEALPRSWVPGAVDILQGADIGSSRPMVLPDLLERCPA